MHQWPLPFPFWAGEMIHQLCPEVLSFFGSEPGKESAEGPRFRGGWTFLWCFVFYRPGCDMWLLEFQGRTWWTVIFWTEYNRIDSLTWKQIELEHTGYTQKTMGLVRTSWYIMYIHSFKIEQNKIMMHHGDMMVFWGTQFSAWEKRTNEHTNEQTDKQTNKRTNERKHTNVMYVMYVM